MKTYEIVVRDKLAEAREARKMARERAASIRRNVLIASVAAVFVAAMAAIVVITGITARANAAQGIQPAQTPEPTQPVETIPPVIALVDQGDAWDFAAMFRAAADDPEAAQRIGEALEANGYFSAAVPMPWEYQDYMRTYCRKYGCPYPLALAVADWETRGTFDMEASGPAGEVGIMQLNPGPGGSYHAEIEAATGLDPTTPEGNIAGGCYRLGQYLTRYEDTTMALMAYNMGAQGAREAWEAGIMSTEYTDAVLEALESWEAAVNAWAGE